MRRVAGVVGHKRGREHALPAGASAGSCRACALAASRAMAAHPEPHKFLNSTCLSAAIAPLFPRRAHSTTRTGALSERPALQAGRAAGRTSRALCTSLASGMKRKMTLAPLAPGTPAPSGVMAKSYTCAGGHGLVTHCPSVSIVKQHLQHVCARHARGAAGGRSPCRR